MTLPQDPWVLLSWVNTQLRDHYSSLASLCDDLELSEDEMQSKLAALGYHYHAAQNRFSE